VNILYSLNRCYEFWRASVQPFIAFFCVRVFKGTVSPDILDYVLGSGKLKNTSAGLLIVLTFFTLNSLDIQKLLFKLLL
jgi:hypothetical protein